MFGIDQWIGLSALGFLSVTFPGALPQAGMGWAFGPPIHKAEIPLPPLATQQAIVAEIEAEQALVAANRELISRFEKKIQTTIAHIWGEETPAISPA
jgi:hypothetical protein